MLYGLPCGIDKLQDLSLLAEEMARYGAVLRLTIDNPGQIMALARNRLSTGPWSIFIKVDGGGRYVEAFGGLSGVANANTYTGAPACPPRAMI
jgi:hypothetical protein